MELPVLSSGRKFMFLMNPQTEAPLAQRCIVSGAAEFHFALFH